MNGWQNSMDYAARDRMHRFHQEAARLRLLRAAPARREGAFIAPRRRAAAALHRLADALSPVAEHAAGPGRTGLEAGRRSPAS